MNQPSESQIWNQKQRRIKYSTFTCLWEPELPGMNRTGIPENFSAFNLEQHIEKERGRVLQEICLPFKVFTLSFSIGVQPILWKRSSHLLDKWSIDVAYLLRQPGRPSWWGHTADIRTCRSLHSRSPLGSTITRVLLEERRHIRLTIDSVLYPL